MALYQQLGLAPGCSLNELKTAYRRRVAEWHPDRLGACTEPALAARLQELTAAYNAARLFHRRYGRLPGAAHVAPASVLPQPARVTPVPARAAPTPRGRRRWPWLVLIAGLVWLWWRGDPFEHGNPTADDARSRGPSAGAPVATGASAAGLIELGSVADVVRALQGRPLMESAARWDYGPSWIGFRDGKVVDWYSSPLRPLKVASAHPPSPPPAH